MNFLRLLPIFLSFLLIAAHFQRDGSSIIALTCLLAPTLLYFTRPWSVRILQTLLILAGMEWIQTLLSLVQWRQELGLPWIRLALILSMVVLFTLLSALIFQRKPLRKRYHL